MYMVCDMSMWRVRGPGVKLDDLDVRQQVRSSEHFSVAPNAGATGKSWLSVSPPFKV